MVALSNVKISGAPGALASGADITNALMFMYMSSRVSENTPAMVLTASFNLSVSMPTAPNHNCSPVPIANRAV